MAKTNSNKNPKLGIGIPQSKANTVDSRLSALIPDTASQISPTLVYNQTATDEVVNPGDALGTSDYGWTAPDVNNGQPYTVQVECIGAGGGGGGGAGTAIGGGGGGGGGEYACEPLYPVNPGETYSYFAAPGGNNGLSSNLNGLVPFLPGMNGPDTWFDARGQGLTGGVIAHGGGGGDQNGQGVGGTGGAGSVNSIHFNGGNGATASAGVFSDNPYFGTNGPGPAHIALNWRMDDTTSGDAWCRDYSGNDRVSIGVIQVTGHVQPISTTKCPSNTPYGASQNWNGQPRNGEVQGNCWKWDHGSGSGAIGGINAPSFSFTPSEFSVSAWIKGNPSAAFAGDWTDGTHTNGSIICNKDPAGLTGGGFNFGIGYNPDNTSNLIFQVTDSTRAFQTVSCTGPDATDGNWHQVVASMSIANNRIRLYVDGVQQTSVAPTVINLSAGGQSFSIGYSKKNQNFGFKGYMSNLWLATTEVNSSYVSAAFGGSGVTSGGGGGASGGSAGAGNDGSGATAGASAAASNPGINTGSGAGGNGGTANSTGSTAPHSIPYGGGGGGAGAKSTSVPSQFQLTVPCSMSGSYAGLDAAGAGEGQLYTVSANPNANENDPWYSASATQSSTCYTGGTGGAPYRGSMNSLLCFPSFNSVNAQTGSTTSYLNSTASWTIQSFQLQLTVQSVNACNLVIGLWSSDIVISALDSDTTLTNYGYGGPLGTYYVPAGDAGRTVTIDLGTTSLASSFVSLAQSNGFSFNGMALQGAGLLIGTLQGSAAHFGNTHGAYNADEALDWYCAFSGATGDTTAAKLIVTYTAAGASMVAAGDGAPGYIVVRYLNDQGTPVATVLPSSYTDAGGNVHAAGVNSTSAGYSVWNPNSSPKTVEAWHTLSLINGWTNQGYARYKMIGFNTMLIQFQINDSSATSGTFAVMPSGYVATTSQFPTCSSFANVGGTPNSAWSVQIGTGAGANITVLDWAKQSKQFHGSIVVSLD